MNAKSAPRFSPAAYGRFLLFIAGMGGLLYGIDVGIVAAALLYLGKTISLSLAQTSAIVAAVFGGSMLSSLVAGFLADLVGRKRMMIFSGFLFVGSVVLIVFSQGFGMLFAGRLLQGMSGGVIAVVVPLYLAECLKADTRGRGSAIFQLMLTVGIVIAAIAGWFYTQQAESAIALANGNIQLIHAAQNHAWRGMFLSVIYPGLIFFIGSFFLTETPRWLFRKGRPEAAFTALERSCVPAEAALEFREMEAIHAAERELKVSGGAGSLLQRKYVIPFLLACVVLGCNQATGINSILGYQVIILKQAGMTARNATQGDIGVKLLNCLMTIVAVALVDRKGRKFLLTLGTAGIIVALSGGAMVFHTFESKRINVRDEVQARVHGDTLDLPASFLTSHVGPGCGPTTMTVLYNDGSGDKLATSLSSEAGGALSIHPVMDDTSRTSAGVTPTWMLRALRALHLSVGPNAAQPVAEHPSLRIREAFYGPVPGEQTGWLVALCLALFIASFSVGPGVVVWLALSELMPTRIRSGGMGIALLINQGVSTLIAGVFLPVVGTFGYQAMFLFWAGCTVIYFITAVFFLPETKGKTLEEIELHFEA